MNFIFEERTIEKVNLFGPKPTINSQYINIFAKGNNEYIEMTSNKDITRGELISGKIIKQILLKRVITGIKYEFLKYDEEDREYEVKIKLNVSLKYPLVYLDNNIQDINDIIDLNGEMTGFGEDFSNARELRSIIKNEIIEGNIRANLDANGIELTSASVIAEFSSRYNNIKRTTREERWKMEAEGKVKDAIHKNVNKTVEQIHENLSNADIDKIILAFEMQGNTKEADKYRAYKNSGIDNIKVAIDIKHDIKIKELENEFDGTISLAGVKSEPKSLTSDNNNEPMTDFIPRKMKR